MTQYKIIEMEHDYLLDETSLTEAKVEMESGIMFYLGLYNVAGTNLLIKTDESQMEKYLDRYADEDENYIPWLESQMITEGCDLEELVQNSPEEYKELVRMFCKKSDTEFETELENDEMTFDIISRRSMFNAEEGMACGPISIASADAEIVIEEEGQKIYLHAQWVDAAGDDILYEATRESTYDVYEKLNRKEGDFDELIAERDRIVEDTIEDDERFDLLYEELKTMIIQKLKENDIDPYFLEEDDEEWDEEDEEDEE